MLVENRINGMAIATIIKVTAPIKSDAKNGEAILTENVTPIIRASILSEEQGNGN